MQLVPIPTTREALDRSFPIWRPFLDRISERSKEPVEALLAQVYRYEVQPIVIWDGERAPALIGVRPVRRGNDIVGEIVWTTGKGMDSWRHLLPDLERYLKDIGCVEIKPICRTGWARYLKQHGYKATHIMMEKKL